MPKVDTIPSSFLMNYDNILNKPFLISTIPWTTSSGIGETFRIPFPSAIMTNPLASVPFEASTYFQARMCSMLQVSGTPMHMGTMVVACVPHGAPKITNVNAVLPAPHVFLSANESTSVCLESPLYIPTSVVRTQGSTADSSNKLINYNTSGTDVFDLVFFVLNPLEVSSGASTGITISVSHIYKEAQFYVPKVGNIVWKNESEVIESVWAVVKWLPACCALMSFLHKITKHSKCCRCRSPSLEGFKPEGFVDEVYKMPTQIADSVTSGLKRVSGDILDYMRSSFRTLTGFHNPNIPTIDSRVLATKRNLLNNVDVPSRIEVLDNHALFNRIYDDFYFRTEQDEMDINHLCSKPVFISTFEVTDSNPVGKILFAYPITPMAEASVNASGIADQEFYSNMRTIYESSKFWRGSLKLHIQASCTNFHFCKIAVVLNYSPVSATIANTRSFPEFKSTHNLPTHTLEFSAGGQIQTIDLPYVSNFRQLECTKDLVFNALAHGIAYGYLVQPLTNNGSVPKNIKFNLYLSGGEDLQFSGYSSDVFTVKTGVDPNYPPLPNLFGDEAGIYETYSDGSSTGYTGRYIKSSDFKLQSVLQDRTLKPGGFVVKEGETWASLALALGVSVDALQGYTKARGMLGFKAKLAAGDIVYYEPMSYKAESGEMRSSDSARTTVEASGQEQLLNYPMTQREDVSMALRPNTSIRDYLRIMTPLQTISVTPVSSAGSTEIVLSDYFTVGPSTRLEQSGNQCLLGMYFGFTGGLKMKLRISGATIASVGFNPPNSYCISGSYNKIYPGITNVTDTAVAAAVLSREGFGSTGTASPFTPPSIEFVDNSMVYGLSDATITSTANNIFQIEFTVPNMNQNNFIGGSRKYYNADDTQNSLGSIIINYITCVDKAGARAPISITPYWGLTDEGRAGFNSYLLPKTLVTVKNTNNPVETCRVSMNNINGIASVIPSALRLTGLPKMSAYYFN